MSELSHQYQRYFDINMRYTKGSSNLQTSHYRQRLTCLITVRFGFISPVIIRKLYQINQHQTLQHLNRLVTLGLLRLVRTHRSIDGRIYVPSYQGVKLAEEIMAMEIYFRSNANPAMQVNPNNIMHDSMNMFILLLGLHHEDNDGNKAPFWSGFITEPEYRKIGAKHSRNVDGLVQENDGTITAIEIEHSFKNKATRQGILLKYLHDLKQGYYHKVFFISHEQQILKDAKRLNEQLIGELLTVYNKKTKAPFLSNSEAELLSSALVYRTKFCQILTTHFYPDSNL